MKKKWFCVCAVRVSVSVQSGDRIQRKHSHALEWKLISFVPIYLHVNCECSTITAKLQTATYRVVGGRPQYGNSMHKRVRCTQRTGCKQKLKIIFFSLLHFYPCAAIRSSCVYLLNRMIRISRSRLCLNRSVHSTPMNVEQIKRKEIYNYEGSELGLIAWEQ